MLDVSPYLTEGKKPREKHHIMAKDPYKDKCIAHTWSLLEDSFCKTTVEVHIQFELVQFKKYSCTTKYSFISVHFVVKGGVGRA